MNEQQHILNKNLLRLYFKDVEINSIGSHVIGFDLLMKGGINSSNILDAFVSIVSKYLCLQFNYSIDEEGLTKGKLDKTKYSWSECDYKVKNQKSLRKKILDEAPQYINPEKGINVAGRLYRINDKKHILSITASHLVADAQSLEILLKDFLKEFKRLYQSGKQSNERLVCSKPSSFSQIPACEFTDSIETDSFDKLKKVCREKDISLFNLLMAALTKLPAIQTDTIGVLFSHRTKETQNEVGCFVQAIPVYLNRNPSLHKTALSVKKQIAQIHTSLSNEEELPDPPRFKVMFSMVKNPNTNLPAPDGVEIKYLRRLHTTPECDLHIYAYQYREKLEIVFNYHPDLVNPVEIKIMLQQYIGNLLEISSNMMQSAKLGTEPYLVLKPPQFHHIGMAVWEMDLGLKRFQNLPGITAPNRPVSDGELGVSLAISQTDYGGQFELIAPLRKDAPCVGFLERNGEGPYHCTWQTSSIQQIIANLDQKKIKYTLIEKSGVSKLFKRSQIHFFVIQGFGLVEFIEIEEPVAGGKESVPMIKGKKQIPLIMEILSNDCDNAIKFIHMIGYKTENPVKGIWREINGQILFRILNTPGEKESRIDRVTTSQYFELENIQTDTPKSLSDNWNKRVCI